MKVSEIFFLLLAYAWCTFLISPGKNHACNKAGNYIVTNVDDREKYAIQKATPNMIKLQIF